MRGSTDLTKRLIHDLNYAQKYTSGVLSWAESPRDVDDSVLEEIMDDFQAMLGVGMEPNRLNFLWVMHKDKGRIELHWIVPNADLQSGKRFAPYFDRTDRTRFRAWERLTNATYGFADPADPIRKRDLRIPNNLPKSKAEATESIHSVILGLVTQRIIKSRAEIIKRLQDVGYQVNRQGKDYISIQDKDGQKLRLRGALYKDSFTSIESLGSDISNVQRPSQERIAALRLELERELSKRSKYIASRYQPFESNVQSAIDKPSGKVSSDLHLQPTVSKATEGEIRNDSITKLGDRSTEEHGSRTQQSLRRIDHSTIELGRAAAIFCRSSEWAISGIRRAIFRISNSKSRTYNPS
ncbi:MAG: relaxase/mobilization nuclease domain-containing protein [Methylotenera sp.]|nr:relaxase/mobilization nuclease domain-containing protein [Methylotenera sp.]MDP2100848.1 relaxase/mobilization nuclease domain-containing protein [Methylotenera sp.]MDP2403851.1 relaxase/mobilization nuclease domain-containing protein [Methylotenera sp.]MDP3094998.1 relaxase/mobilization nuclease domain-containing protein [Methylotenera sp.]MDP3206324.1 relaxase/mobilization nuclease domain-containing protein [Methylotenera sp.]